MIIFIIHGFFGRDIEGVLFFLKNPKMIDNPIIPILIINENFKVDKAFDPIDLYIYLKVFIKYNKIIKNFSKY